MISKATNNILFRVIKYLLELNLWNNTTRHQAEDSCKNNIKLIDFVEQYAAARQVEERKNYTGRSGSVRSLIKHLKALGAEDTLLIEVDLDFCQQFVTYLRSAQDMHHHLKTPKKLADSTILSKIKIFSAVLNEAVRFRLLEENPMGLLHTIHHTARVQKRASLPVAERNKKSDEGSLRLSPAEGSLQPEHPYRTKKKRYFLIKSGRSDKKRRHLLYQENVCEDPTGTDHPPIG